MTIPNFPARRFSSFFLLLFFLTIFFWGTYAVPVPGRAALGTTIKRLPLIVTTDCRLGLSLLFESAATVVVVVVEATEFELVVVVVVVAGGQQPLNNTETRDYYLAARELRGRDGISGEIGKVRFESHPNPATPKLSNLVLTSQV